MQEIDVIIAKVLANEATEIEIDIFNKWLDQDHAHQELFTEMLAASNDLPNSLNNHKEFNSELAWQNISRSRIDVNSKINSSKTINWLRPFAAAAAIALGIFIVYELNNTRTDKDLFVAVRDVDTLYLGDGSRVLLQKGSQLEYPESFEGLVSRDVKLTGIANFDIKKDKKHPFTVTTPNSTIRVLGTNFDVHVDNDYSKIAVNEGSVKVKNITANKSITLKSGEQAVVHEKELSTSNFTNRNYAYWYSKKLEFNNYQLSQAFGEIAELTNLNLEIDDAIKSSTQLVTIQFKNQAPEKMLQELCLISGTVLEKQGNKYLVRAK